MFRVLVPVTGLFVAVLFSAITNAQVLFEDDLSDGSNFQVFGDDDSNASFGFDYSQSGIPPAPNGNDTIGLVMAVNIVDPAEAAEIAVIHVDDEFNGQYTFTVDIWNNWHLHELDNPTKVGTTEFSGAGVGHAGFFPGPDGASFMYDGDGDTSRDYRLYKNAEHLLPDTDQYSIGVYEPEGLGRQDNNNSNPALQEAFPGFDVESALPDTDLNGNQLDGAGGFQWMTVTIEVDTEAIGAGPEIFTGVATVKMTSAFSGNTVEIGRIDNSIDTPETPVFMDESISLLMSDIFSSVSPSPQHSFAVFDNVKVVRGIGIVGPTCDFDDDGVCNTVDIDLLSKEIIAGTNDAAFDLNGDGLVDLADQDEWRADAAAENGFAEPYLNGDADLDGSVIVGDLNVVGTNWQASSDAWSGGDFNADGMVGVADLNLLGLNWQDSIPTAASAATVPEPSTLLLAMWMLVLARWSRGEQRP